MSNLTLRLMLDLTKRVNELQAENVAMRATAIRATRRLLLSFYLGVTFSILISWFISPHTVISYTLMFISLLMLGIPVRFIMTIRPLQKNLPPPNHDGGK
jgi:hypothetical protein